MRWDAYYSTQNPFIAGRDSMKSSLSFKWVKFKCTIRILRVTGLGVHSKFQAVLPMPPEGTRRERPVNLITHSLIVSLRALLLAPWKAVLTSLCVRCVGPCHLCRSNLVKYLTPMSARAHCGSFSLPADLERCFWVLLRDLHRAQDAHHCRHLRPQRPRRP